MRACGPKEYGRNSFFQGLRNATLLRPRAWLVLNGTRHSLTLFSRAPQRYAASPSRLARAQRHSPFAHPLFKGSATLRCFALASGSCSTALAIRSPSFQGLRNATLLRPRVWLVLNGTRHSLTRSLAALSSALNK